VDDLCLPWRLVLQVRPCGPTIDSAGPGDFFSSGWPQVVDRRAFWRRAVSPLEGWERHLALAAHLAWGVHGHPEEWRNL
jgi:hypothetical protein